MLISLVYFQQGNVKKLMKIVNTDEENLHIFHTTQGNSMKFPGKMCLMTILKVTNKQSFTLSLENAVLEKQQEGGQINNSQMAETMYVP